MNSKAQAARVKPDISHLAVLVSAAVTNEMLLLLVMGWWTNLGKYVTLCLEAWR